MKADLSKSFELLLDTEYQQHISEVMNEWCGNAHTKLNTAHADLVDKEISKPLWIWIDQIRGERKAGNYSDIEAAEAFASKAEDIVYIFRYNIRPLYPEHVAMLNDAWTQFQRSIAHGLHVRNRILNELIDNQPSLKIAVAEELQRRSAEEIQKSEARKRKAQRKWQSAGSAAARIYTEDDEDKWLITAKKILKKSREIKSIRGLARKIQEETDYPFAAEETIRKTQSIINLLKEHKLKKNIG